MRVSVGYPARDDEPASARARRRRADAVDLQVVCDRETLLELQAVEEVHVSESLPHAWSTSGGYARLRRFRSVPRRAGRSRCSTRALVGGAQDRLWSPQDVKAIAVPALAHRLTLQPELWVQQVSAEDVMRDLLETVPVPPTQEGSSS